MNEPKINKKFEDQWIVFISVLGAFIWLSGSFIFFSKDTYTYAEQFSKEQLEEVAVQTANTAKIKIQDSLSYIQSIADIFGQFEDIHSGSSLEALEQITKGSSFDRIRLTTPDGMSLAAIGNEINISDREYFQKAIKGESGISETMVSLYNEERIFVIYTPVYNNGKIIGTLHGACEVRNLSKQVNMVSFGGKGYSYIFRQNGDITLDSSEEFEKNKRFDSMIDVFRILKYDDDYNYTKLLFDIKAGKSDYLEYSYKGEKKVAYYMPVGIEDWYLFQVMPKDVVGNTTRPITKFALILLINAMLVFVVLIFANRYVQYRSKKALIQANKELKISNDRFEIAISHTTNAIFEFDMETCLIRFITEPEKIFELLENFYYTPEDIAVRITDSENTQIFYGMVEKIKNGETIEDCVFPLRKNDNTVVWGRMNVTSILDDKGRVLKAIGTLEDITEIKEIEIRYAQEEKYRHAILSDSFTTYDVNITKDIFIRNFSTYAELKDDTEWRNYSSTIPYIAVNYVHPEDRLLFLNYADKGNMLRNFEEGEKEQSIEYRVKKNDGSWSWVHSTTHILKEPQTGDIKSYVYMKDINESKLKELAMQYKCESIS